MTYLIALSFGAGVLWFLALVINASIRGNTSGLSAAIELVTRHPMRMVLPALAAVLILCVVLYFFSKRLSSALCAFLPLAMALILMLYQCADMTCWYLVHHHFLRVVDGEPFRMIGFSILYLFKGVVLSGIGMYPALYGINAGIRGRRHKRPGASVFPTDVILTALVCCLLLGSFALLSQTTGFGMHYFTDGYLHHLF